MAKNPHADFSPSLLGYTGQGAFRFWCQMALPLTYDDSLSYYELLNKVVTYLNNTIEDVANVETNVDALSNAYNQLQKYVNDYFDDLNVEEELRNVLDKMALDGSLDAILTPLVEAALPDIVDDKIDDVVADQIDAVVGEQIGDVVEDRLPPLVDANVPDAVSDWLGENVDPVGSAVLVDTTLSISGAAADAKVTGDKITDLKEAIGLEIPIMPTEAQTQVGWFKVNSNNIVSVQSVSEGATDRAYTIDLSEYIGRTVSVLISNPTNASVRKTGMMNTSNVASEYYEEKVATSSPWVFDITSDYPILFCSLLNPQTSPVSISVTIPGTVIGPLENEIQNITNTLGNTPMGTNAETITGAIAEVNDKIDSKELFVTIQPAQFPQLPYPIYKDGFGKYTIGTDILSDKDISDYYHYYVDSVNGSDSNNGTTPETPFKTLYKGLYTARNKNAVITITGESIMWDEELYGEYLVNGNLVIKGNGCTLIWGVEEPEWTETETTGVYISKDLSEEICGACIDLGNDNVDMYGLYKGMKPATSLSEIAPNQYYYDTTTNRMYAYPRTGGNIENIHPLRTGNGLNWKHTTATTSSFIYLEDIKYIGNYIMNVRSSNYPQTAYTFEHYCVGCQFSHCYSGDCVPASNYDIVYLVDCVGGYALRDIFNHHAQYMSSDAINASVYVNVNCEGEEAGWYDTTNAENNNLFTAHEGLNILRCNCNGSNAEGPMLVDVGGCRSVVMDCTFYNNGYENATPDNQVWFDQSEGAGLKRGFATVINVYSADKLHPNSNKLKARRCNIEIFGGNLLDKADFSVECNLKIGI